VVEQHEQLGGVAGPFWRTCDGSGMPREGAGSAQVTVLVRGHLLESPGLAFRDNRCRGVPGFKRFALPVYGNAGPGAPATRLGQRFLGEAALGTAGDQTHSAPWRSRRMGAGRPQKQR
jgi:hypothetical protein